jgi:hypothetical protein
MFLGDSVKTRSWLCGPTMVLLPSRRFDPFDDGRTKSLEMRGRYPSSSWLLQRIFGKYRVAKGAELKVILYDTMILHDIFSLFTIEPYSCIFLANLYHFQCQRGIHSHGRCHCGCSRRFQQSQLRQRDVDCRTRSFTRRPRRLGGMASSIGLTPTIASSGVLMLIAILDLSERILTESIVLI